MKIKSLTERIFVGLCLLSLVGVIFTDDKFYIIMAIALLATAHSHYRNKRHWDEPEGNNVSPKT